MAVNLLEEDRLVYHDNSGDTCEISTIDPVLQEGDDTRKNFLIFHNIVFGESYDVQVDFDRDAVKTLRDALTCWLETGKLK